MKEKLLAYLKGSTTLKDISTRLIELLNQLHQEGNPQIGYVAGMISSEGPENIQKNLDILERRTQELSKIYNFPLFSQNDIFTDDVYKQIKQSGATHADFEEFYQQIHSTGLITHIFMTPKWELSVGATDEHETALRYRLNIIYIK